MPSDDVRAPDVASAPHVAVNRAHWDAEAARMVASGERCWASERVTWGMWDVPEEELELLGPPGTDLTGIDAVELGCGTGYVSGWLARRGARVTGIDVSPAQLATARRLAALHGVDVAFVEADAEALPLANTSVDLAVSEYGASLWCEPERWLAEAARVLRPGGRLAFLTMSRVVALASPPDGSLPVTRGFERPWFALDRMDWTDAIDEPGGIEFTRSPADWMRHLRDAGFEVLDHREVRAPADASGAAWGVPADWARDFPSEETWVARRR
jgi:ubiquinone/menaquinone biosynthesis C-methylase UbiE